MVRLVGLAALIAPVLGARVTVHDEALSSATVRGLELFEQLKENMDDVNLQKEYSALIGDVDFHESRVFLETGAQNSQPPPALGGQSAPGQVLTMAERTGFVESLGRFLTNRRDYVWEQEGGNSKYVLDGRTMSLHSRMFVSNVGDSNPRFILRRAYNYLNPISTAFGQFVYRVIQCSDSHEGSCDEGDILYTITKDRLGRGALWGMDEYRVYTGTGGCSRFGFGIVSCAQEAQVMYSLGAGLSEATFDTDFYSGNIVAIHGNGESGTMFNNGNEVRVGAAELAAQKVGHTTKVEGPPRWLNWVTPVFPFFGAGVEFVRAAIWTDSYRLRFDGAADELLVCLMASAQDLTRDVINARTVQNAIQNQANAAVGAASGSAAAAGSASAAAR
jgi:hypothetical protein